MATEETRKTQAGEGDSQAQHALKMFEAAFGQGAYEIESIHDLKRTVYTHREVFDRLQEMVVELAERHLAGGPDADKAGLDLAVAKWMLGRYSEAVDTFSEVRWTPFTYYVVGLCYKQQGAYRQAEELLSRANERQDTNKQIAFLLAQMQSVQGNTEAAAQTLQAANAPESADSVFTQGMVAEMAGEYEEARACFEKAIELDPQHIESIFRLAYNYDIGGDDEMAMAYYLRCLKIEPAHSGVLMNLGLLHEDQGRYQEAMRLFERVLVNEPNNARAKLYWRDAKAGLSMYYDEEKERKLDKRNRVLETPITDFELSVRSRNCLDLMGISTLGDLIRVTEAELLSYNNFGETSLNEIKTLLASKGLRLGQGLEEPKEPQEPVEDEKPEKIREMLASPVNSLSLDRETIVKLKCLGIDTLGELTHHGSDYLVTMGAFSSSAAKNLAKQLAERDLSLK